MTITAWSSRNASDAAGHVHDALERAVGLADRLDLAPRARTCASRCRCRAARRAGSRRGRSRPGTRRRTPVCWSRWPGIPSVERAAGVARVEEVRVEELARARRRRGGTAPPRRAAVHAVARRLVAGAAAVDQVGRAGGPQPGVVEVLEHRLVRPAQVGHVHVVDRVVERADDPEGARRGQRRAVLDVALLAAVVPVHRRDVVLGRAAGPGGDRSPTRPASPRGTWTRSRARRCRARAAPRAPARGPPRSPGRASRA